MYVQTQYVSQSVPSKDTHQEQGPHGVIHKYCCCRQEHEPAKGFVTERLEYALYALQSSLKVQLTIARVKVRRGRVEDG
jgi:hypothetical protein